MRPAGRCSSPETCPDSLNPQLYRVGLMKRPRTRTSQHRVDARLSLSLPTSHTWLEAVLSEAAVRAPMADDKWDADRFEDGSTRLVGEQHVENMETFAANYAQELLALEDVLDAMAVRSAPALLAESSMLFSFLPSPLAFPTSFLRFSSLVVRSPLVVICNGTQLYWTRRRTRPRASSISCTHRASP